MRFSFCVIPTQTVQQVGDLVQRAESWDADMVWIPDEAFMRDPYVLLGAVASRVSKVGLGVGIANPYTRHPMQLTRAICTAADLRGGDMVFGIGAGLKSTRAAINANEGEFVQTTRDCIAIMKLLMAGETVSFDSPVFKLDKARLMFQPTQKVPIHVASTHRDAFVMAGEIADGVIVGNVAEPEAMAQVVSWVHEGANRAGRDPKSIEIVAWNIAVVDDDAERAYDIMRGAIAKSVAITHRAVRAAMNIDHDTWQGVHAAVRHGKGEITPKLVPNALIDKYAIVGSAKRCGERMRALEQAGATMMGVRTALELNAQYDWESNVRTLSAALKA
jgi:5,10-methylenetetrahydromethanopterin reductase